MSRQAASEFRVWRRAAVRGIGIALAVSTTAGMAQLAPRYRGTLDAPTPQLTLPTPTPVSSPRAAVVEDIIVRVNDQIIDRSDVERQRARMQEGIQQGKIPASEVPALERDMLRDMIDEQLLISRGKELDVNVDSEVVRQMDEIRKQNHLDSMEALEKAVRESGISYEDWRADLKNQMIRQTVVRDEVGRTLHRPTTKEEQAFYDAHKQEFTQPEQIRLSEILIPTPENATDAQVAAAQAKADDVVAKLKGGAKFADLAKQVSGGPTADKGGDLGLFKRGALAKVLEDQTFPLKAGEWTQPIRTRQGFVVLSVAEHLDAGAPPLKDVEEQVQEAMFQEQMAPALRKYLTDLREKAYIDIAPGFVDSGASPNEVKPTFAANTPPPVKKKSTAAKKRLETGRSAAVTPVAAVKSGTATSTKPGATVQSATLTGKKKKKVRREKIRFGQAPQNALPAAPQETSSTAGVDQNETSAGNALASPGEVAATTTVADVSTDPLGPVAAPEKKTRFSDRAATEKVTKAKEKSVKAKAKALETPTPMTATEKTTAEVQNSALGLGGDNATKKKKKKQKGEPKERLQQAAPAPAAPKPIATPIPPKTVRENGEPTTTPVPSADKTTLPPANSPAPGANVDTTPATPAQPAGSQPMPPTN